MVNIIKGLLKIAYYGFILLGFIMIIRDIKLMLKDIRTFNRERKSNDCSNDWSY